MTSTSDSEQDTPNARQVRAFDAASSDFARLGVHLWNPIGEATVRRTDPDPGERVLDACCGHGASAIPAARRVGPRGWVDAVDLSAPLIDELRRSAAGLPQLRAHVADVTSWPNDGYEVVQAVLGIFFFPDMTAGVDHLVSRARPGGRVGFTIWRRDSMVSAGRTLQAAVARVAGVEHGPRPPALIDRVNEAEPFRRWLAERGLRDVRVDVQERRLALTPELAWLLITGSGFMAALADLDDDQVDKVRDAYLTSLAEAGIDEVEATTLIGLGTR